MRQHIPQGFVLDETIKHPLTFRNPQGDNFNIEFINAHVVRVYFQRSGEKVKTSLSVLKDPYVVNIREEDNEATVVDTPALRLRIYTNPLRLVWSDLEDHVFAEDLPHRSYAYDLEDSSVWHYQRRRITDKYYGLGERTGDMNLAGRRFRLERVDCMGYDAETQDPMYKFFPFYLTLTEPSVAHGIYYNNFATTTLDFGKECDAAGFVESKDTNSYHFS